MTEDPHTMATPGRTRPGGSVARPPGSASARRATNTIDVLRFLGCISIVWIHSGYYWQLGDLTPIVDAWKRFSITWAMPFFYVATARFALDSAMRQQDRMVAHAFRRTWRIMWLLALYTILYEIFRDILVPGRFPAGILDVNWRSDGWLAIVGGVVRAVLTMDATPGYFLWHVAAIQLVATAVGLAIARAKPSLNAWKIGCVFVALMGLQLAFESAINQISATVCLNASVTAACVTGFSCSLMRSVRAGPGGSGRFLELGALPWLAMFLAIAPMFGLLQSYPSLAVAAAAVWSLGGDVVVPKGALLDRMSRYGQDYSMGVFIWHIAFLWLFERLLIRPWVHFHLWDPSILLFCLINLAAIVSAFLWTRWLQRFAPRLTRL